eukprot:3817672-Prymnesium_polylepis.1
MRLTAARRLSARGHVRVQLFLAALPGGAARRFGRAPWGGGGAVAADGAQAAARHAGGVAGGAAAA